MQGKAEDDNAATRSLARRTCPMICLDCYKKGWIKNMSTFSLLLMLLFLILFGIQFFMYFVNIEMPRFSGFLTLLLILMVIVEILLAVFEWPAALIDLIVLICMGNKTIALFCAIVIFTVVLFFLVVFLPKLKWQKILRFTPMKYVLLGFVVIALAIYTELFNGSYSFHDMNEYRTFKQSFAKYDRHFWPTKFIKKTEDNGRRILTTYSVYPWDVEIDDGKQLAYKVITFYSTDDDIFYYYPFTYDLYNGPTPLPVEHETSSAASKTVSDSDTSKDG